MNASIEQLMALRQSGIYAIVNTQENKIQIFYSRNMLEHFNNLTKKLDNTEWDTLKNDISRIVGINIIILEYTDTPRFLVDGYIQKYRNEGCTFYKESYLIRYILKSGIGSIKGSLQYLVYLENKRSDRIILGSFSSKEEGEAWKALTYPNDIINKIIYKK